MAGRGPRLIPSRAALLAWGLLSVCGSAAARGALSDDDLAKKRQGWFVTGLPLAAYSSDLGFGYGARVYLNGNGAKTDPAFATTPYLSQVYVQYFATTGGWQYHQIAADVPGLAPRWRARGYAAYERNTNRNFFGIGEVSLTPLPAPNMGEYQERLDAETPFGAGSTNAAFHRYELVRPICGAQAEYSLTGELTVMAGFEVQQGTVKTFDGKTVTVDDADRMQGPTFVGLFRPSGAAGGWLNHVRAGLAWDTRDYEPNPRRGVYADVTAEWSGPATGSDYDYSRLTMAGRHYLPVCSSVVIATRLVLSDTRGTPPFYEQSTLGFTDNRREALGGGWSLRGYRENRFSGSALSLANAEVRWTAGERTWGGQRFALLVLAFADGGRVFDAHVFTLRDWKGDAGGGVRIVWNQSTIINATYGRSGEDAGVFINFGHQF